MAGILLFDTASEPHLESIQFHTQWIQGGGGRKGRGVNMKICPLFVLIYLHRENIRQRDG
jgi:hypothetical protein